MATCLRGSNKRSSVQVLSALLCSLSATLAFAEEGVKIITSGEEADSAGIFEPRGDYSDGNLSGSRAKGDDRGGESALIMELSSGSPRATVAYRSDRIKTKQNVLDLRAINFDYFASASLVEEGQDLSLKIRCSNDKSITHSFPQGVQTESWINKSIDLSTAKWQRGETKTLAKWVNDANWCHGNFNRVLDLQIGAGSNDGIGGEAQVYLDYLQFGEPSDIHNFELPPEAPVQQGTIIDAIMGGGMVRGTECVNGKVDPEAIKIETDAMSYGPDQTLYVSNGSAVNLRSADDYAFRAGDEVFSRVIGGGKEGNSLTYNCQYDTTSIGQFGTADTSICTGGSLPFGSGEGSHQLVFLSENGTEVVLGRLFEATSQSDNSYSCSPPGLLPPDKPQMRDAKPHASGGMQVEFGQEGPGGDPDYYLYEMTHEGGIANRGGRVVDEQGADDTSSPFVIIPEAALSETPGQWKVRIQAWNAAGESP
ncbi:MAG: hypothetical protein P8M13_09865, partial [Luminiphilus sp.]|nr:hypothetical protein [Luminiphilus sp.]